MARAPLFHIDAAEKSAALETRTRTHRATVFQVTEDDPSLVQIIGRQFQGDLVTRQDLDEVLLHAASRVGDQRVTVIQVDAKTRIRQDFGNLPLHFNQFFFGHLVFLVRGRATSSEDGPGDFKLWL